MKYLKYLSVLVIILLIGQFIMPICAVFAADDVSITFEDQNLYDDLKIYFSEKKYTYTDVGNKTIKMSQSTIDSITLIEMNGDSNYKKVTKLDGIEKFTNLVALGLYNHSITDITPVSQLTKLTILSLYNNQITSIDAIKNLTNLTDIELYNNKISNISALSGLKKLKIARLYNNQITDISSLSGLTELTTLSLNGNQISNISALSGLTKLTALAISDNNISDISVISNLTNLTGIYANNNKITTIPDLSQLTQLTTLQLNQNQITNNSLSKLKNITTLTSLYLSENSISDISDLSGLTNLIALSLYNNSITSITPIKNLTKIYDLSLGGNQITDISALSALTEMQTLYLYDNQITDISALSGMTKLTKLYLQNNTITSIESLKNLTSLTKLSLYDNQITDISALSGMTKLTELYLQNNTITSISALSALTEMQTLYLYDNQITDISALSGMTKLTELYLQNNTITSIESLKNLTSLTKLSLYKNQITDVSSLSNLTNLQELNLGKNNISNIEALSKLTNLTKLVLEVNKISNIEPLAALQKLTYLSLFENEIQDVSKIANLTNLTFLSISDNNIEDISSLSNLTNLETLGIYKNNIKDISVTNQMTKLTTLHAYAQTITVNNVENGSKVTLPKIFTQAKDTTSKGYTTSNIAFTGCSLDSDGKTVTVYQNVDKATVKIEGETSGLDASSLIINTIDTTAPVLDVKYSTTEKTNNDVTVTINTNEAIQEVEGWTLSTDKKLLTKIYTANGSEEVTVKDLAGNVAKANISVTNIDKIAPKLSITYSTTKETNQNVIVTISADKEIQKVEGWTLSTDKKSLTKTYEKNGSETVTVIDLYENKAVANISVTNIDKIAPEIDVSYSTKNSTNQNVIVTITANEKIQEIEGWTLSEDGKILTKTYTVNGNEEITVKDLAGNEAKATISVTNIDKKEPKVEVKYSTTLATNQDVVITITSDEEIQGIEGWTLSEDKKTLTKTYTENGEETIKILDISGNESEEIKIVISNIDKTEPTGNVVYSITDLTNKDVIVTITVNEEVEEVEGWTLSEDRKSLTKTYTLNGEEKVILKDLAGNIKEIEVAVNNIDKTSPTLNVKYSTTLTTDKDVIVTISSDKEIQEVEGWTLSTDKKSLTKTYTENGSEEVIVTDLAGNSTKVNIRVNNIKEVVENLPSTLPYTGEKTVLIIAIIIAMIAITFIIYRKIKKYDMIK